MTTVSIDSCCVSVTYAPTGLSPSERVRAGASTVAGAAHGVEYIDTLRVRGGVAGVAERVLAGTEARPHTPAPSSAPAGTASAGFPGPS